MQNIDWRRVIVLTFRTKTTGNCDEFLWYKKVNVLEVVKDFPLGTKIFRVIKFNVRGLNTNVLAVAGQIWGGPTFTNQNLPSASNVPQHLDHVVGAALSSGNQ